jgi:hypothetical protein
MDFEPSKFITPQMAAGIAGAAIGAKMAPGATWGERLFNMAAGSACAAFVAPALGEMFHLSSTPMQSCMAFFLGMFGMSAAAAITTGFKELKLADIIAGWISKGGPK